MVSGGLVARKKLAPNQKIRNVRADGKRGVNTCAGNFLKKIQLLFKLFTVQLRSRKVKLHSFNGKTSA